MLFYVFDMPASTSMMYAIVGKLFLSRQVEIQFSTSKRFRPRECRTVLSYSFIDSMKLPDNSWDDDWKETVTMVRGVWQPIWLRSSDIPSWFLASTKWYVRTRNAEQADVGNAKVGAWSNIVELSVADGIDKLPSNQRKLINVYNARKQAMRQGKSKNRASSTN
jgi:hypothetical protein